MPPETPRPTEAELAILQVLWSRGPSTVREVHDELSRQRRQGYTTVLKLMQIMAEKGLVDRDESERAHVYTARRGPEATEGALVGDLMERVFQGSASRLVMRALSSRPTSSDELAEIRRMLDGLEAESSGGEQDS